MFDVTQGATAGAHIDVTTKSGTNDLHGSVYGNWETSRLNASPYFTKQAGLPRPDLHRYVAGAELGGPILRDKLFLYGTYQYTRDRDQLNSSASYYVPAGLTDDRSLTGLQPVAAAAGLPSGTAIDPVALQFLQAKLPSGQYLIRSPAGDSTQVSFIGLASKFLADQANGNLNYNISNKDSLAFKYYFQHDPTESPFSSTSLEGFPQKFNAGSQVFSLENTSIFSPHLTWEQKFGFIRMNVASLTGQPFNPATGWDQPFRQHASARHQHSQYRAGATAWTSAPPPTFPTPDSPRTPSKAAQPSTMSSVGTALSFGGNYDFTQLNILNRANQVASHPVCQPGRLS